MDDESTSSTKRPQLTLPNELNESYDANQAKSSMFRTALRKLSQKAEQSSSKFSSSAAATFFSRTKKASETDSTVDDSSSSSSSSSSHNPPQMPGKIKHIRGAQFPPIWEQAPPAPTKVATGSASGDTTLDGYGPRTAPVESTSATQPTAGDGQASSSVISNEHDSQTNARANREDLMKTQSSVVQSRWNAFSKILEQDELVDLDQLQELSWGGIPTAFRWLTWQLLLGYLPSKKDRREMMIQRKRQEYMECIRQYYDIPDQDRSESEQKTLRQIVVDIPRTHSELQLFKDIRTQQCMERILYIWAIRHPASGYVQGINDLLTPFFLVCLTECCDRSSTTPFSSLAELQVSTVSETRLSEIEADCYWCLTKLLDGIQDHYTFAQPGLQRMVLKMEELVHRCDEDLHRHLVDEQSVTFMQFAFRWMNCLLMREVPVSVIIRLWDTYLAETGGFERFHVYVCVAFLLTFNGTLKDQVFPDVVLFLQDLPTKDWTEHDVEPLLSKAFILKSYFEDAPNHLNS